MKRPFVSLSQYAWIPIGTLFLTVLVVCIVVMPPIQQPSTSVDGLKVLPRPASPLFRFFDKQYFLYEMRIVDIAAPLTILGVQVRDAATNALIVELNELPVHYFFTENNTRIQENDLITGVVYFFVAFPLDAPLPNALTHIIVSSDGSPAVRVTDTLNTFVLLNTAAPPVIGSPFVRDTTLWYAIIGPAPDTIIRTAIVPLPGPMMVFLKYGIEWVSLNSNNHAFINDGSHLSDWDCYGRVVVAVANATVVAVYDALPDNVPGDTESIIVNTTTVLGNTVVLQLDGDDDEYYVCYGYLKPESIVVQVGQRVAKGAPLAQIGNSGGSVVPHLHLHVMDRPNFVESESVSYVFDSFDFIGATPATAVLSGGNALNPMVFSYVDVDERRRTDELPLHNTVIQFSQ